MASIRTKRKILPRLTIPSAMPARLIGLRNSMRERCHGSCWGGGVCSVSMGSSGDCGFVLLLGGGNLSFTWLVGRICAHRSVEAMLIAIMMQGHLSVPPRPVHWVNIGVQEYLVEGPHDDRQGRKHRLIEVNGSRDVKPPARHVIAHENLGPQHDAGYGHHDHAPDQSPVFSLLRVIEAGEPRLA